MKLRLIQQELSRNVTHRSGLVGNWCRFDIMGIYFHVTYGIVLDIASI
jgi:hypothetical protein